MVRLAEDTLGQRAESSARLIQINKATGSAPHACIKKRDTWLVTISLVWCVGVGGALIFVIFAY
jgi:hypothetical protein